MGVPYTCQSQMHLLRLLEWCSFSPSPHPFQTCFCLRSVRYALRYCTAIQCTYFSHFVAGFSGLPACTLKRARLTRLTRLQISFPGNYCDATVILYIDICTCHCSRAGRARLTRFHISLLGHHSDTAVSLSIVICTCHCSQTGRARLTRSQGWQTDQGR